MSIGIIIRQSGYSSKKHASPRFTPHYNRSTERYYRSSSEYYSDLKSRGLEPYDASAKDCGKRAPYQASKKTREIVQAIGEHTKRGKFKASGKLISAMESVGVKMQATQSDMDKLPAVYKQGGFYESKG